MSEDALIVITSAIKTAFIDHPGSGHGTMWDPVTKSDEESIHLAKAVLVALRKAGYFGYQDRRPECPKALKARSSCRRDRRCHLPMPLLLARSLIGVAGKANPSGEHRSSRVGDERPEPFASTSRSHASAV